MSFVYPLIIVVNKRDKRKQEPFFTVPFIGPRVSVLFVRLTEHIKIRL